MFRYIFSILRVLLQPRAAPNLYDEQEYGSTFSERMLACAVAREYPVLVRNYGASSADVSSKDNFEPGEKADGLRSRALGEGISNHYTRIPILKSLAIGPASH